MSRLYRQLALVTSAMLIAVVAATPSSAQESRRTIGNRITSARQYDDHNAPTRRYAVRPVQYTFTGDPETIASGAIVDGTVVSDQSYLEDGACCDSGCGSQGCGRRRRRQQTEGAGDPWYNCSCNGSYKFPVPPLYTYHWPGMYSQELMTNYHSPWRFPPLRPYEDEPTPESNDEPQAGLQPGYLPVGHQTSSSRRGGYEPLSAKIERFYGTTR